MAPAVVPPFTSPPAIHLQSLWPIGGAADTVWQAKIVRTKGALDENALELFAVARVDDPFGLASGHPPLRIGQPVTARMGVAEETERSGLRGEGSLGRNTDEGVDTWTRIAEVGASRIRPPRLWRKGFADRYPPKPSPSREKVVE